MFRLNVEFREKEQVKAHGAKWNAVEKFWYFPGDVLPKALEQWYVAKDIHRAPENEADNANEKQDAVDEFSSYKTVSQVNLMVNLAYDDLNEFHNIMVKGEVTNFTGANNGHYYFAIKDESALLSCVMFSSDARRGLGFELEKGQQVAIKGDMDYYIATGKSQLRAKKIYNIGDGAANLAFLRLKERLRQEGLFDPQYKKELTKHPQRVGIITSKDGRAIGDVCSVAKERNPYVELILYHVKVQGRNAVKTVVEGIKYMDEIGVDTLIICRGGGSQEELIAYNHESIARAAFEAKTPIISAVGHEDDWSLLDYVADVRVLTPTQAANAAIPNVMEDIRKLRHTIEEMTGNMNNIIRQRMLLLSAKQALLEKNNPKRKVTEQRNHLDNLVQMLRHNMILKYESKKNVFENLTYQMNQNMKKVFEIREHRFDVLLTRLNGLSPTAKLVNGFGYISKDNSPVIGVDNVMPEDKLNIRMHDGEIEARVIAVEKLRKKNEGE